MRKKMRMRMKEISKSARSPEVVQANVDPLGVKVDCVRVERERGAQKEITWRKEIEKRLEELRVMSTDGGKDGDEDEGV